jgi:hypothetical protein
MTTAWLDPDDDEDVELTELVAATFPRVDLVGKPANGVPRFLIAKAAHGNNGLMEAAMVRQLISKAKAPQRMAVYDSRGKLLGTVDPEAVEQLDTGAAAPAAEAPAAEAPAAPAPAAALPPATAGAAIAKAAALQGNLSQAGMVLAVLHARSRQLQRTGR